MKRVTWREIVLVAVLLAFVALFVLTGHDDAAAWLAIVAIIAWVVTS